MVQRRKKKHVNWPCQPEKIYANNGWNGWSNFVNKENPTYKHFMPFKNFQDEVRKLYPPSGGDVARWYQNEKIKHPNWLSHPPITYKREWTGWPELVGKENRLKKK